MIRRDFLKSLAATGAVLAAGVPPALYSAAQQVGPTAVQHLPSTIWAHRIGNPHYRPFPEEIAAWKAHFAENYELRFGEHVDVADLDIWNDDGPGPLRDLIVSFTVLRPHNRNSLG